MASKREIRRILAVRTDRIGDLVLTLPSCTALKARYPDASITLLTRDYTEPIARMHKAIDEVIVYDPDGEHKGIEGAGRLGALLSYKNFDMAVLFYSRPELALALWLARIPLRYGTGMRWYNWFLLNRKIYKHRKKSGRHELELGMDLIEGLVGGQIPEEVDFGLVVPPESLAKADEVLEEVGISTPFALVHPGSGDSAPNLPSAMFGKIARHLHDEYGFEVIIAGTGQEVELVREVKGLSGSGSGVHTVTGMEMETYIALISKAAFFTANSTGPLHLARALNVVVLGFFCNAIPCAPNRWGPYGKPESVLTPNVPACASCDRGSCEHGNCLNLIHWSTINDAIEHLLGGEKGSG